MIEENAYPCRPARSCHPNPVISILSEVEGHAFCVAVERPPYWLLPLPFFLSIPEGNLLLAHPPTQPVILSEGSHLCEPQPKDLLPSPRHHIRQLLSTTKAIYFAFEAPCQGQKAC